MAANSGVNVARLCTVALSISIAQSIHAALALPASAASFTACVAVAAKSISPPITPALRRSLSVLSAKS